MANLIDDLFLESETLFVESEILCICGHVLGAHREAAWECGSNCPCDEAVPAIEGLNILRRDLDYPWPAWHSWPWDGEAARRWADRYLPAGASW